VKKIVPLISWIYLVKARPTQPIVFASTYWEDPPNTHPISKHKIEVFPFKQNRTQSDSLRLDGNVQNGTIWGR
jgi:hypothetical protein